MLVFKQISSISFKKEITNKLFTYKSYVYIYLNVCEQTNDVKLFVI